MLLSAEVVSHKAVSRIVRAVHIYTYRAPVARGGLDGLICVVVATTGEAYLIVCAFCLGDGQQTAVDAKGGLFGQSYGGGRSARFSRLLLCSSVKDQFVAVAITNDALFQGIVAAAVHNLARYRLGGFLRNVRNAHLPSGWHCYVGNKPHRR